MIQKINSKRKIDILEALNRIEDLYNDFYITINKERKFLKLVDFHLIEKILNVQDVYILEEKEVIGILLIYKEKGFRPYIKILSDRNDATRNLFKFLIWNYSEKDLFIKIKKENPMLKIAQKYGFIFSGDRGQEILLFRKGEKRIMKLSDKSEQDIRRDK